MDEYIGIVKLFAGTFAPRGWMLCQGQLLPVAQYSALFSIIGNTYGGTGTTTFALPNLCGLTAVGTGTSRASGTVYKVGEVAGSETTTILTQNMPPHQHSPMLHANTGNAQYSNPTTTSVLAAPGRPSGRDFESFYGYTDATPDVLMSGASVTDGIVGGGMPVSNMQPYIAMNYIICIEGLYPPRP